MPLTDKQARFVEEYLVDLNATQAAVRAGYSEKTAGQVGFENLKKPEIQDAISAAMKTRAEEAQIDAAEVLQFWAEVMRDSKASRKDRLNASEKVAKHLGMYKAPEGAGQPTAHFHVNLGGRSSG